MDTMIVKFSFLTKDDVLVDGLIRDVPSFDPDLRKRRVWKLMEAWTGEKINELLEFETHPSECESQIKRIHERMNAA